MWLREDVRYALRQFAAAPGFTADGRIDARLGNWSDYGDLHSCACGVAEVLARSQAE